MKLTKTLLSLLLALLMVFGLVACAGDTENPGGTDAPATGSSSNSSNSSDSSNSSNSSDVDITLSGYDEDMDHLFFATDVRNRAIVLFDLGKANGVFENLANGDQCIVWEWVAGKDKNCKIKPGTLTDAKIRYSPYYQKDVVIACADSGWCAVIDYEECTVIWEYQHITAGPHSIEMMPNGDLVVAGSNVTSEILYIPLSAGAKKPSHSIPSDQAHGVMYDPENNLIWCLDFDEVYACMVSGYGTANAKLARVNGNEVKLGKEDGHVLTPVYGEPGKYWVASSPQVYQFDTETLKLTETVKHYNDEFVKGIAYYPDKTMIMTVATSGNATTDWSCGQIRVVTMELSAGKVQKLLPTITDVDFSNREFYKVIPFTKDYQ